MRKVGEGRLTLAGLLCMTVGYGLLAHVGPVWPLAVATVVSAFGNALMRPCLTSLITLIAKKEEQGVILGVTLSLSSIASILAAPLAGWLIDHAMLSAWAWTAAGIFSGSIDRARVRFGARPSSDPHRLSDSLGGAKIHRYGAK